MSSAELSQVLRGPFHFLACSDSEFETLFPEWRQQLPTPYPIFAEDEASTLFHGFPLLTTEGVTSLRDALAAYLEAEEGAQVSALRREPFLRTAYNAAWSRYRALLAVAIENSILASYGRPYPALLWLHHSLDVARQLRDTPRRLTRLDLRLGQRHGEEIRFRVYEKLRERLKQEVFSWSQRLTSEVGDATAEAARALLFRMLDNVLIFTEEQISPDLMELTGFLNAFARRDARLFRQKLERLVTWHRMALAANGDLAVLGREVLGRDPALPPEKLLFRPGYLRFLASRPGWDPEAFFAEDELVVWEDLLARLRDFEFLNAFRNLILPVRWDGARLLFRAGGLDRTWVGQRSLVLSPATRPLDFFSATVTEPLVHRFGLIYDISNFSEVITVLARAGSETQERAFRQMFNLQRRISRVASRHRLQLEKYLGDGAFYTSRRAVPILVCALELQECYRTARALGLPFDRGMRIGLNFGHYRLIPIQTGNVQESDRYEFFGHGVVELTRLTSGKRSLEIDEIKTTLISYGYPPQTVVRFFEPLEGRNLDLVDRQEEARPFYAYINRSGTLINEGIVATHDFLVSLSRALADLGLSRSRSGKKGYLIFSLDDPEGQPRLVGIRRLGIARLKGLDTQPLYEVVDAQDIDLGTLEPMSAGSLLEGLERLAAGRGITDEDITQVVPPPSDAQTP